MRRILVAGVVGSVLYVQASAGAVSTQLIKNGSFEKPVVTVGGYQVFSTGSTFSHWTAVGAPGNVAVVSGTFTQNGFTFPAKAGQQWVDLTGLSQTATGVSQTVATTPGIPYTLTFYVGNVYDPNGVFGSSSAIDVLVNGSLLMTAKNSKGMGTTTQVWKKFTIPISGVTSSTTIEFLNADPATDTNNGLDVVKLVPAAVG